jgi:hypothetical protein
MTWKIESKKERKKERKKEKKKKRKKDRKKEKKVKKEGKKKVVINVTENIRLLSLITWSLEIGSKRRCRGHKHASAMERTGDSKSPKLLSFKL